MSSNEILYVIEEMRGKLNCLVDQETFVDPEVIELSQLVDSLLNLYHYAQSHRVQN
jgi:hypothetical protein